MAVTKHTQKRRGLQNPLLSWPNNTSVGPRRPSLKLLKKATHNHHKNRISKLSASSGHNVPEPKDHLPLHSQASRASGYSKHKAHKGVHRSKQTKKPNISGLPPKQHEKSVAQQSISHATQAPQGPSESLTDHKAAGKTQENKHISNSSPPSSLTSEPPPTDLRPVPAKGIDWPAYERAKALRFKQIRIWVHSLHRAHRIVASVAKELMAYYGSEKYGDHPSARSLSRHAWQAVKLCEREFGTDLQWAKGLGEAVWGSEHAKVEKLIGLKIKGEGRGSPGMGTVGESDLSDFEDEKGAGGGGGAGVGEDVEMGEAA
ncbi:hypothetical protein BDR22DRAFT_821887 [Usnea florida]